MYIYVYVCVFECRCVCRRGSANPESGCRALINCQRNINAFPQRYLKMQPVEWLDETGPTLPAAQLAERKAFQKEVRRLANC